MSEKRRGPLVLQNVPGGLASRPGDLTVRILLRPLGLVLLVMVFWGGSSKPDLPPAWIIVDTNHSEAALTLFRFRGGSSEVAYTGSGRHWEQRVEFGTYRIEYHHIDGFVKPLSETKPVSRSDGGCFQSEDVTTNFKGVYYEVVKAK